jgi:hypothetical protein
MYRPHRVLRGVIVDNPFYSRAHAGDPTNPRKINAVINIQESAITMLASRNRIAMPLRWPPLQGSAHFGRPWTGKVPRL